MLWEWRGIVVEMEGCGVRGKSEGLGNGLGWKCVGEMRVRGGDGQE